MAVSIKKATGNSVKAAVQVNDSLGKHSINENITSLNILPIVGDSTGESSFFVYKH